MIRLRSLASLAALLALGFVAVGLIPSTASPQLAPTVITLTTPSLPAPLPPPPTATVTVPLPLPPPPAPAPPPPTVTASTPVTTATVAMPTPPATTTARTTTTSSGTAPPPSTAQSTSPPPSASAAPPEPTESRPSPSYVGEQAAYGSEAGARRESTPRRGFDASTVRSGNRVAVRLEFELAAARRMFLVVRGPAPSCEIVGVVPLRGRRGENVVRFSGRIDGSLLPRGIYRLTVSPTKKPAAGGEAEAVRVVSARRTVAVPDSAAKLSCTAGQVRADSVAGPDARRQEPGRAGSSTPEARPNVPLRPPVLPVDGGGGGGGGLAGFLGFWTFAGLGLASAALVGLLALGASAAFRARRGF